MPVREPIAFSNPWKLDSRIAYSLACRDRAQAGPLEIPTNDVQRSAEFYWRAFGWQTRQRGDGSTAFDDTVHEVSGTWVLGRPPAREPGLMVYIMVASAADAVDAVASAGGEIVQPVDLHAREVTATFRDPAGNLIGIYQQPGLAETEAREARDS